MKLLISLTVLSAALYSTTAAPWVFLNSHSDMVALSSEISDTSMVVVAPPPQSNPALSSEEDSSNSDEKSDLKPKLSSKEITSVETEPTHETLLTTRTQEDTLESKDLDPEIDSTTQTTINSSTNADTDVPELSSTTPTAELIESDIKKQDMDILVVPEPATIPEQNPNSIEEYISGFQTVILNKKKHTRMDAKPHKYRMNI